MDVVHSWEMVKIELTDLFVWLAVCVQLECKCSLSKETYHSP